MTIVPHREISRITKERWQRGSPPPPYSVEETKEIEGWGRKKQLFLYSTKPEGPEEQRERERERTPKVRYVELRCSHYVFRYRLKVARKIAGFHEALCRVQLTGPLIVTCSETTITRLSLILNFVSKEKKRDWLVSRI